MKEADYFTEVACRTMLPMQNAELRPLIFNLFRQCQADAFEHAAGMAAEWLNAADPHLSDTVAGNFRQLADVLDPGIKASRRPPAETPSNFVVPGQELAPETPLPPAA